MGAFTKGIFLVNVAFQVYHWEYSPKGSLHWELLIHSWHAAKGREIALSWRDASENLYALIDLLGSGSILLLLREERHLEPSKSISHALYFRDFSSWSASATNYFSKQNKTKQKIHNKNSTDKTKTKTIVK